MFSYGLLQRKQHICYIIVLKLAYLNIYVLNYICMKNIEYWFEHYCFEEEEKIKNKIFGGGEGKKCCQPLFRRQRKKNLGATMCIGREIRCLPCGVFLDALASLVLMIDTDWQTDTEIGNWQFYTTSGLTQMSLKIECHSK